MPRPIHFEMHAGDPQRAIGFYNQLFGWTFTKWDSPQDYWLIKTGAPGTMGIDGGLLPRHADGPTPLQAVKGYVCTVDVPDLAATLKRVAELGGKVVVPTVPIPTVGWLAYAVDTETNVFGMMQMDAAAK